MAPGAFNSASRRTPAADRMSQPGNARPSADDEARIAVLLQTAARAHHGGSLDRLKAILEEILDIDPDHANANYNLGILYRDREEIFKAEVHLRRAIKVDPTLVDAYQALADLLFGAKHLLPAAKTYEEALERAPNRLPLLLNLSKTRMMLPSTSTA